MKTLILLALLVVIPPKPSAITQVKAYAVSQHEKITITNHGGYVWVEMSDSDIFGVGTTEELAAEDFLSDLDLVEHERSPQDIIHGQPMHMPFVCPPNLHCI